MNSLILRYDETTIFHSGGMVLGKSKLVLVLKNQVKVSRGDPPFHIIWPFSFISSPFLTEKSISSEIQGKNVKMVMSYFACFNIIQVALKGQFHETLN